MDASTLPLDILAQQPRINRLYTHLTLCFAIDDENRTITTERLSCGCNILSQKVPWTAGEALYQDSRFQIRCEGKTIPLVSKQDEETTFEDMKTSQFPARMVHEATYSPCKTMATTDATKVSLPVFIVQANYVRNGLLLTFAGQHGAMDVTGLGQLIYLFSKACRDDSFTRPELDIANAERWNGSGEISAHLSSLGRDHTAYTPARSSSSRPHPESLKTHLDRISHAHEADDGAAIADGGERPPHYPANGLIWTLFTVNKTNLDTLKRRAAEDLLSGAFISTDDVLSAFIWVSITRARANSQSQSQSHPSTEPDSDPTTTLSRNVDMRPYLSIDPTHPGLLVQDTTHTSTTTNLLHQQLKLGHIAVQLRSALDPSSLRRAFNYQVRNLKTGILPPRSQNLNPRNSTSHQEVRLSSWSKVSCYDIDLGFGKPVAVRRPAFTDGAREGLVYFLPRGVDGRIAVMVCLDRHALVALREDPGFMELAEEIG